MALVAERLLAVDNRKSSGGRAPYISTALDLAAAFQHDFSCCLNEAQKRRVCRKYRDKILAASQFADAIAAAFDDAFPASLRL